MNRLSPALKGFFTGIFMILTSLLIYRSEGNFENNLQYITYTLYVAGIAWALFTFHNQPADNRKFRNYFSEGFRCFVVVTLMMVLFTFIFLKLHPSLREEMGIQARADLLKKGNYTPAEVDGMVETAKKYYITVFISSAVFGYLMIGALVTAIISAIMIRNKKPVNQV